MVLLRSEKNIKQIKNAVSKKKFSYKQQETIEYALDIGLNDDELELIINRKLSSEQMLEGIYGFMCGLQVIDVEQYLKPDFSIEVIRQLRLSLMKSNERQLVPLMINSKFNLKQIIEIRKGSFLPIEYVKLYACPYFSANQMAQIRMGFENKINYKIMSYLCNCRLSVNQLKYLRSMAELGMDESIIHEIAKPEIPEESMFQILKNLKQQRKCNELRKKMIA